MRALLLATIAVLGAAAVQEDSQPSDQLEQHKWLQQLVGEWNVTSEASMGPDGESVRWESKESVRAIGDFWIVTEGTADNNGTPFTSLMTLGYDPSKKAFVGTWIDTLQTTLWSYVGQLDESRRTLTLEAEGPSLGDPTKTAKYRDQVELIDANLRRMTSSMLAEDGSWTTFMTVEARRK